MLYGDPLYLPLRSHCSPTRVSSDRDQGDPVAGVAFQPPGKLQLEQHGADEAGGNGGLPDQIVDRGGARPVLAQHLAACLVDLVIGACRSEEHTSELQSLMRISYAVFSLKIKTQRLHNIECN